MAAGYTVLASAISARSIAVATGGPADRTHSDGRTIVIDPETAASDIGDAVAVHAAMLAVGSFRKDVVLRLTRQRSVVAQRYLALETARACRAMAHVLPSRTGVRVATAAAERLSRSPDESLRRALSREPIAALPAWVGVLLPARLRQVDDAEFSAVPTDSDLARFAGADEKQPEGSEPEPQVRSRIVDLLSAPGTTNLLGEALQRLLGMRGSSAERNQGGDEIVATRQGFGSASRNARRGPLRSWLSATFAAAPVDGTRYPEWDCDRGCYRQDWCAVAEFDAPDRAVEDVPTPATASLARSLRRVGLEAARHRRQRDGDELDCTALVDYQLARLRGDDPDPAIYQRSRLTRRELSILVLLDCSGSTAEITSGQSVFDEERVLAGELTHALEHLGARVGTYGFFSRGRGAVTFLRIKGFDTGYDTVAKRRLQTLQPSGFTRTGAAVRHAAHMLQTHAMAKNMVLLVIGDGLPYDDGYEDRYARADSRQAIEEVIGRGVGVVGLAIRSSTKPEVLEDIWSIAPFRVVDTVADAQRHLQPLLASALSCTRSNGGRREPRNAEHQVQLRLLNAAARSKWNTYA